MKELLNLDGQILLWIQEYLRVECLNGIVKAISFLGNGGWFWIVTALFFTYGKNTKRAGIMALVCMAICALIVNIILKNAVARIRPYEALEGLTLLVERQRDYSFPSGHTSASFAAAWMYFKYLKKSLARAFLVIAALISLSRLYVGVHYPSDVLAGFLIASAVSFFLIRAEKKRQVGKSCCQN